LLLSELGKKQIAIFSRAQPSKSERFTSKPWLPKGEGRDEKRMVPRLAATIDYIPPAFSLRPKLTRQRSKKAR